MPTKMAGVLVSKMIRRPRRAYLCSQSRNVIVTHALAGNEGWAPLAVVIECHDLEIIGYELALRGEHGRSSGRS